MVPVLREQKYETYNSENLRIFSAYIHTFRQCLFFPFRRHLLIGTHLINPFIIVIIIIIIMQHYQTSQKAVANYLEGRPADQNQKPQKQDSQPILQLSHPVPQQNVPIVPINYAPGQFSTFAIKKQRQKVELANYIDKIINEAIQSHIGMLKQITGFTDDLRIKSEKNILAIEKYCSGKFNYAQIIQRPAYCYANSMVFNKSIVDNCKQFMQLCLTISKFIMVEGFLIKKSAINMSKYIMEENYMIIPFFDINNAFLKIEGQRKKSIVHNIKRQYFEKKGLYHFTRNQQQNIIQTVVNFLTEKNIIFDKTLVKQKIENRVLNSQQEISKSYGVSIPKKQDVKNQDDLYG